MNDLTDRKKIASCAERLKTRLKMNVRHLWEQNLCVFRLINQRTRQSSLERQNAWHVVTMLKDIVCLVGVIRRTIEITKRL